MYASQLIGEDLTRTVEVFNSALKETATVIMKIVGCGPSQTNCKTSCLDNECTALKRRTPKNVSFIQEEKDSRKQRKKPMKDKKKAHKQNRTNNFLPALSDP